MNDKQIIYDFLDALEQSGLQEDRKVYWMARIASPDFSEVDEKAFEAEMQAQMDGLTDDIRFLEFENDSLKARKTELLAEALPPLQKMVKEAPALMDEEFSRFKEGVLDDEKVAMDEIEGLRGEKESEEMEAIRKRLGKG